MKLLSVLLFISLLTIKFTLRASETESYSNIQFRTFSTEDGLSQSSVLSLTQDPQGFIWMGTKDGLNRFDGYRFRTFKTDPTNPNSISNNEILFLSSNSKGNIFIGTRGGSLNYYIKDENRFKKFDNLDIIDETVTSVSECSDGNLFIGTNTGLFTGIADPLNKYEYQFTNLSTNSVYLTTNNTLLPYDRLSVSVVTTKILKNDHVVVGTFKGLFLYKPNSLSFTQIDLGRLTEAKINSMVWDKDSTLWIGTSEGLAKLYFEGFEPQKVELTDDYEPWTRTNTTWVEKIISDNDGNMWIATRGAGVIMWDTEDNIHSFYNNSPMSYNIGDNIINSLLIDNSGILWIGTESRGVVTLDLYRKKFNHLENYTSTGLNLTSNLVTAITGNENEVWVGSAYNGLDYLRLLPGNKIETRHIDEIPYDNGLTSNEIISLHLDKQNKLWIGTASNYLVSLDKNGRFESFPTGSFTFALHQDKQNDLWIGSWGQGLGLKRFNSGEIRFISNQPHDSRSLSGDIILSVYDDSKGKLWVGTKGRGLNVTGLDAVKKGYNNFVSYEKGTLLHNDIYCVLEDSEGIMWIGTGGGLNRIDLTKPENNDLFLQGKAKFESFTEKDGLPANLIYGILEDNEGNIWLSTTKGLSKYEKNNQRFVNYDTNHGLQSNEFHSNAFFSANGQQMFFGGVNGLTFFNPEEISVNNTPYDVVFSSLKVLNQIVNPNEEIKGKVILTKDIANTKEITLNHKHKDFSIEFSARHLNNLDGIKYAYRLLGFDDEWRILSNNEHSVSYTNLWEDEYTFQVIASNDDGVWSTKPTELIINVLPPIWRSIWFYPVYLILLIIGLLIFRRYSLIKATEKNRLLIEHIERTNLIENTEAKMRFFTNISHEIRTPLTLISNPLDDVITHGNIDQQSRNNLELVSKNVNRLIHLTNQLLQLRKIDKGGIEPHFTEVKIRNFLKEITSFFMQKSYNKDIKLVFESKIDDDYKIWIDTEMMTTAIYNILSNAFKYTPSKGTIRISLFPKAEELTKVSRIRKKASNTKWVCISVSDTGIGIPSEDLSHIFHRFYQSKQKNNSEMAGSGIGLSIVKEYVDLNKGSIEVSSKLNEGTTFTLYLPIGDDHIKDKKIALQPIMPSEKLQALENGNSAKNQTDGTKPYAEPEKPTLLIIEDDKDLCAYLENALNQSFHIHLAYNGDDGFKKAIETIPSIIVSDVMMPHTDGLILTKQLKSNEKTRHIPIILLTAKAADESKMEGYKSGADLYVSKPFKIDLLKIQIEQLLTTRKVLSEIFSKQIMLKPRNIAISSSDEKFLTRLNEVIDEHLQEPDFDVAAMVEKMNQSHSTVLKRVKTLTGMSLVEFVKSHRLKRAAQILEKNSFQVAEVAYMVGFSDPKYFSKCFSKEFGKTPTEFINESKLKEKKTGE